MMWMVMMMIVVVAVVNSRYDDDDTIIMIGKHLIAGPSSISQTLKYRGSAIVCYLTREFLYYKKFTSKWTAFCWTGPPFRKKLIHPSLVSVWNICG